MEAVVSTIKAINLYGYSRSVIRRCPTINI